MHDARRLAEAVLPQLSRNAGAELQHLVRVVRENRQGYAEVEARAIGGDFQAQLRASPEFQFMLQRFCCEARHISASINISALHQTSVEAQMTAAPGRRPPWVMHPNNVSCASC